MFYYIHERFTNNLSVLQFISVKWCLQYRLLRMSIHCEVIVIKYIQIVSREIRSFALSLSLVDSRYISGGWRYLILIPRRFLRRRSTSIFEG